MTLARTSGAMQDENMSWSDVWKIALADANDDKAAAVLMLDEIVKTLSKSCPECSICEGQDHHWMPHWDDSDGLPLMVCKHCPARREMSDDDEDAL